MFAEICIRYSTNETKEAVHIGYISGFFSACVVRCLPITINVVSSNLFNGGVHSIQQYVLKVVSD
jgi:hypothetical protein